MLGYERKDLLSGHLRWTDLTPPEWRAGDKQRVERVKKAGRLLPFEKEFFHKDGTRVPVMLGVARFKEPRTQAAVFALDMSRPKRAAAAALESRMIEHTRTARKLHDVLMQNLEAVLFRIQAARNWMTRHPEDALQSLNDAIHDGEQALEDSRSAIQEIN
jgi:signal transduction histidine kinase